jgi:hypothetical protein
LGWRFGYVLIMGVMLMIAVSQLLFFRWKGWLGSVATRTPQRTNGKHQAEHI